MGHEAQSDVRQRLLQRAAEVRRAQEARAAAPPPRPAPAPELAPPEAQMSQRWRDRYAMDACSMRAEGVRGLTRGQTTAKRICYLCGEPVTGRRIVWCSEACRDTWVDNHYWNSARFRVAKNAGFACTTCGSKNSIEVNHKEPLVGRGYHEGCHHHLAGLEALCHACHVKVTTQQGRDRAAAREATGETTRRRMKCGWCGHEIHEQGCGDCLCQHGDVLPRQEGERLTFGIHRIRPPDARTAPAWAVREPTIAQRRAAIDRVLKGGPRC